MPCGSTVKKRPDGRLFALASASGSPEPPPADGSARHTPILARNIDKLTFLLYRVATRRTVMFVKAICFKDVQVDDVVCKQAYKFLEVGGLSEARDPYIELFIKGGGIITGRPNELIGLVRRPRPEGKTEGDMLNEIRRCAFRAVEPGRPIIPELKALLEAIEAHELSKSPEKKPERNESLVDRHMML